MVTADLLRGEIARRRDDRSLHRRHTRAECQGLCHEIGDIFIDRRQCFYEMLALPLSRDGAGADMLLNYREATVHLAVSTL